MSTINAPLRFTDYFFQFPIKVYNPADIEEAELCKNNNIPSARGIAKCRPEQIATYHESFTLSRSIENVKEKGCDTVRVYLNNGETYTCLWNLERFEDTLNKFCERLHMLEIQELEEEENMDLQKRVKVMFDQAIANHRSTSEPVNKEAI